MTIYQIRGIFSDETPAIICAIGADDINCVLFKGIIDDAYEFNKKKVDFMWIDKAGNLRIQLKRE